MDINNSLKDKKSQQQLIAIMQFAKIVGDTGEIGVKELTSALTSILRHDLKKFDESKSNFYINTIK